MIHDIGLFKSGPIDDAVSRFVGGRKDGWHGKERQARQEQNGSSSSSKDIRQRARVRACVDRKEEKRVVSSTSEGLGGRGNGIYRQSHRVL